MGMPSAIASWLRVKPRQLARHTTPTMPRNVVSAQNYVRLSLARPSPNPPSSCSQGRRRMPTNGAALSEERRQETEFPDVCPVLLPAASWFARIRFERACWEQQTWPGRPTLPAARCDEQFQRRFEERVRATQTRRRALQMLHATRQFRSDSVIVQSYAMQ